MNDPAIRTDRDLFEAASSGDATAFAELASRHARGLYDFALRGTLDERQAEAVVLATFRRVREPVTDVPVQIDFRTWLYSLGLVEVLAVSNETRTARISTDDERFFQRTSDLAPEIAHWAWQAARGLRTRDYCVLDLTLRRGLTPEEVAEAASLTRSNLYASIGRARGAFEETFAAMLLFEHGRDACSDLDEMVDTAPGTSLRPALRHQIIEHSDGCDACRRTLGSLPPAASVYVSLADIEIPEVLARRASGVVVVPQAVEAEAPAPASGDDLAMHSAVAVAASAATLDSPGLDEPTDEDEDEERTDESPDEDGDEDDFGQGLWEEAGPFAPAEVPPAMVAPVLAHAPDASPVTPVHREQAAYEYDDSLGDRVTAWVDRARGQPLMWTYALLGILAVITIYLGIALADSLESGGRDSGAVPLDSPPSAAGAEIIACDVPIALEAGALQEVTFDETPLEGFTISDVTVLALSADSGVGDLTATQQGPFAIRLEAAAQPPTRAHTDEFELRIQWQRGDDAAQSSCNVQVNVPG